MPYINGPTRRGLGLRRTYYLGWIGHQNLGDEAMYQAVRGQLALYPWWSLFDTDSWAILRLQVGLALLVYSPIALWVLCQAEDRTRLWGRLFRVRLPKRCSR